MPNLTPGVTSRGFFCALASAAFAAVLIASYFRGFFGPFILDDSQNLLPVFRFIKDETTWQYALFENTSGIWGRAVSMFSFWLNGAIFGADPFSFKLGNFTLHLANGVLVYFLLRRLCLIVGRSEASARIIALVGAGGWLSLAIHVSTVLYVVQRMSQLSAFFALSSLIIFVRWRMLASPSLRQTGLAWLGVVVLTAFAALSKENGVLVFPLLAVIELTLFQHSGATQQRTIGRWIIFLFVVCPLLAIAGYLLANPNYLSSGYDTRTFTLDERLLTQPRVLWDYMAQIIAPNSKKLGLFHDDFALSTSLLTPISTLPAILGLFAAVVVALILRTKRPSLVSCGILFYLIGQSMESSFINLEIYFEHRNYLPSVGVVIAAAGIAIHVLGNEGARFIRPLWFTAGAIIAANLWVVWLQSNVWSSTGNLLAHAERSSPDSVRIQMLKAQMFGNERNFEQMQTTVDTLILQHPRKAVSAQMMLALSRCTAGLTADVARINDAVAQFESYIDNDDSTVFGSLSELALAQKCAGIGPRLLAQWGETLLNQPQSQSSGRAVAKVEHYTARSLAELGEVNRALPYAEAAWRNARAPASGVLTFQIRATLGDLTGCREILAELKANRLGENQAKANVQKLEAWLLSQKPSG